MCHSCLDTGRVVWGPDTESGREEHGCLECMGSESHVAYVGSRGSVVRVPISGDSRMSFVQKMGLHREHIDDVVENMRNRLCDSKTAPVQPVRLKLDSKGGE
jgi:hypothetical protein